MNNILDNLYADYITYMESVAPLESLGDKNSRLRVFRNHVMLNCDWTQSSHSTLSQDERERQKKKAVLAPLKGKVVDNKLSNKDVTNLLQAVCLELGITDENHVVQ